MPVNNKMNLLSAIDNLQIKYENVSTKSDSPEGSSSVPDHNMDFNGKIKSISIGQMFVKENTGYIKDFYKISSRIG